MRSLILIAIMLTASGCRQEPPVLKEIDRVEHCRYWTRMCSTNGYQGPTEWHVGTRIVFKDRGHIDFRGDVADWWKPGDKVLYDGRKITIAREPAR